MVSKSIYPVSVLVIGLLASCAAPKTTLSYSEDLSANRPVFTSADVPLKKQDTDVVVKKSTPPSKNVNRKVDAVLDSIDKINLTRRYLDGFTIQVYSGQKREDAMQVKMKMISEAGDLPSNLQYIQPKFRVTVGSYISRIEAQKDLVRLKKLFSAAILLPERIALK